MAPEISEKELDEIYAFAVQLGKDAGKMLMDTAKLRMASGGAAHESVEKENAVDIVTKTDTGDFDASLSSAFAPLADTGPHQTLRRSFIALYQRLTRATSESLRSAH